MGFTFGFTEDIEEDENHHLGEESAGEGCGFINPIDQVVADAYPPKAFTLEELLQKSCVDTRVTFEPVRVSPETVLYRRELFDVRHQLMMEDERFGERENQEFSILIGETGEDLKSGVYEGGLKCWECSFDVITKLNQLQTVEDVLRSGRDFNVIELGCGTALPTLNILNAVYQHKLSHGSGQHVRVLLSDFNYDVLRLVTLPNILINWCSTVLDVDEFVALQTRAEIEGNVRDREIDVTAALVARFQAWLRDHRIELAFISGSWGREFMHLVDTLLPDIATQFNVVLTSESIYSPSILPVISEMMVELTHANGVSILSAKDIYFGVGGSIVECQRYLSNRDVNVVTTSVDGHIKRSILEISQR